MAQKRKSERSDSGQDSEKFAKTDKPAVLSERERLGAELSTQPRYVPSLRSSIHEEFTKLALSSFAEFVAQVTQNPALSIPEKLDLLARIQDLAAGEAKNLVPTIPDRAPKFWSDRDDPDANPFIWAHSTYGAAAQIMIVSDFERLDRQLGKRLANDRNRGKPMPIGYEILTKKERDRDLIENPPTLAELVEMMPLHLQRMYRAHEAGKKRASYGKHPKIQTK